MYKRQDTLLEMLPSRALFLPETKELLICDIHLGKAEYFQQNGIPLTNNSDKNNFARIKKIVKKYSPEKLIILGDLFHSKYAIDKTLQKKVENLPELLKTNVELVLGNRRQRQMCIRDRNLPILLTFQDYIFLLFFLFLRNCFYLNY